MTEIWINGKRYEVPDGLTILQALEWTGHRPVRGVGCRGGFCGACGTLYRLQGDYQLRTGLACQTVVEPGMNLGQIPFFPTQRAAYELDQLEPKGETLREQYPEIERCFGCNTCTKACPQELDVMGYMAAALRGDVAQVAEMSFDCIQCGLCVARCPAELAPPNVALLARRLYGKYMAPPAKGLPERVAEVEAGAFREAIEELEMAPLEELQRRYEGREIEA